MRNREAATAKLVRQGVTLARASGSNVRFEILALDETSVDNTLSVLSILHSQVPQLRTFQDLEPGSAIMRAARVAHGRTWLLVDDAVDEGLSTWAVEQVFRGKRAAVVPGTLLCVERGIGQAALSWTKGGLVTAQRQVESTLKARGEQAAFSPPNENGLRKRASIFVRGRLGGLGLDKPG